MIFIRVIEREDASIFFFLFCDVNFNTVNKSECIRHVVFECALNVLSWNVAIINKIKHTQHTHTHSHTIVVVVVLLFLLQNVDGDSWSQQYCWARGEIH